MSAGAGNKTQLSLDTFHLIHKGNCSVQLQFFSIRNLMTMGKQHGIATHLKHFVCSDKQLKCARTNTINTLLFRGFRK